MGVTLCTTDHVKRGVDNFECVLDLILLATQCSVCEAERLVSLFAVTHTRYFAKVVIRGTIKRRKLFP